MLPPRAPLPTLPQDEVLHYGSFLVDQIANSEDISARGKVREIAKLYAQAKDLRRKPGGGKGKNPNNASLQQRERRTGKPLDRRMFADKRQVNAKQKKKDAKKAKRKGRR